MIPILLPRIPLPLERDQPTQTEILFFTQQILKTLNSHFTNSTALLEASKMNRKWVPCLMKANFAMCLPLASKDHLTHCKMKPNVQLTKRLGLMIRSSWKKFQMLASLIICISMHQLRTQS